MNVSAQPHISPFRYPGGKTRLTELIHLWLLSCDDTHTFIEPFAGGASAGLYVAAHKLASKVVLVEKDPSVSAVWQTILSRENDWLCDRVTTFKLNRKNVVELLNSKCSSRRDIAFQTLVRNRVSRSGLMWNGAGLNLRGENNSGISSRWYPETLVNRIRFIKSLKDNITFIQGCGLEVMKKYRYSRKVSIFVDPPYSFTSSSVGRRLYRYNNINHQKLFHLLVSLKADFLLTHEDNSEIRKLAKSSGLHLMRLQMPTAQNITGTELLIGQDIKHLVKWIRSNPSMHKTRICPKKIPTC